MLIINRIGLSFQLCVAVSDTIVVFVSFPAFTGSFSNHRISLLYLLQIVCTCARCLLRLGNSLFNNCFSVTFLTKICCLKEGLSLLERLVCFVLTRSNQFCRSFFSQECWTGFVMLSRRLVLRSPDSVLN